MRNRNFLASMSHAANGLIYTVRTEKNFRFDICAALYAVWFAAACDFSKTEWAVLALAVGLVLFAETMNTALERAVDAAVDGYDDNARRAKDAAAGAVLICAFVSVCTGVALFADMKRLTFAFYEITGSPFRIAVFAALTVFSAWFVLCFGKNKNDRKGIL